MEDWRDESHRHTWKRIEWEPPHAPRIPPPWADAGRPRRISPMPRFVAEVCSSCRLARWAKWEYTFSPEDLWLGRQLGSLEYPGENQTLN